MQPIEAPHFAEPDRASKDVFAMPQPAIDTVYPLSPPGVPFATRPAPLVSELQQRLDTIGRQDVGRQS